MRNLNNYDEFMAEAERLNPEGFAKAHANRAEADALRKDAQRYRWVRDTGAVFTVRSAGDEGRACELVAIGRVAQGLDAAIDAAMAAGPAVGAA